VGDFDRSSKWLIQHHGDSLLRLAGVQGVRSWRALQSELVQTGQLPDGLIEAEIGEVADPALFIVEVATYPEQRVGDQLLRDTLLVVLDRRALPEVLTLVLHPKGKLRVAHSLTLTSPLASTELTVRWQVVELWNVPARELLESQDPGLMPWLPLTAYEESPETILRLCREVIDRRAAEDERPNLLAVTQVLARLRYNDSQLLAILGGRNVMIESPLIQEIVAEARAKSVLRVLSRRFGAVPQDVDAAVRGIQDDTRLEGLLDAAVDCADLEQFRTALRS
jgi:hypothetical protein